jgi:hypothetical protein
LNIFAEEERKQNQIAEQKAASKGPVVSSNWASPPSIVPAQFSSIVTSTPTNVTAKSKEQSSEFFFVVVVVWKLFLSDFRFVFVFVVI